MGRKSKRANPVRTGAEFDRVRMQLSLKPRYDSSVGATGWTVERIRTARDDQMRGVFREAVAMAEASRTDDALFPARRNRAAPIGCVGVTLTAANSSAPAKRVAKEAEALFGARGIGTTETTLVGINRTLADHAVAIGVLTHKARPDGSRIDTVLTEWPLCEVSWSELDGCYTTHIDPSSPGLEFEQRASNGRYRITHGDGRWVVFQLSELHPYRDACILPAGLVWARHAFAAMAWMAGSDSHGNPSLVGTLPEGVALLGAEGALTQEAAAFLQLIHDLRSGSGAGIKPFGSEVDLVINTSTAWQVWHELMLNAEKAAARIYLGTDGMLGAQGGAPGVDIAQLFGVATTIVQGDLDAITSALHTGVIQPWAAINFGTSLLAPVRAYNMPDPDAQRSREDLAKRREAFHAEIERLKKNGFEVDQEVINTLARDYGVPAMQLAPIVSRSVPIEVAPTDKAKVVRVGELRRSMGLVEPTPEDGKFISQLEAQAVVSQPTQAARLAMLSLITCGFDESKIVRAEGGKFGDKPNAGDDAPKAGAAFDADAAEEAIADLSIKQADAEEQATASDARAQRLAQQAQASAHQSKIRHPAEVVKRQAAMLQEDGNAAAIAKLKDPKIIAAQDRWRKLHEAGKYEQAEELASKLDGAIGGTKYHEVYQGAREREKRARSEARRVEIFRKHAARRRAEAQRLGQEMDRLQQQIDADNDGRTGKAEEADDAREEGTGE